MAGRPIRSAWCGVALFVIGAALLPACRPTEPSAPPLVRITVGDAPHEFPMGTTLGDVIHELSLQPHDGRLLSVSGAVLDLAHTPGSILLNGIPAPSGAHLRSGDRVRVADGADITEPIRRTIKLLPGRHLGNPERTLRRFRIRRATITGEISGHVIAVRDTPLGRGTTEGQVALSFDDGPWPVQTRKIIRILRRFHVPATFFMVGYLIDRYPGIVRMVERAGMGIGDHSWDHPIDPPFADLAHAHMREEIGRARTALGDLGIRARLFRPPGGSYDDPVVQEARRQGMRVVTWSVDPRDWAPGSTARRITHRVLSSVQPGSIILLHDGGGDRGATIRALPRIIEGIRARGFQLVAIPARA